MSTVTLTVTCSAEVANSSDNKSLHNWTNRLSEQLDPSDIKHRLDGRCFMSDKWNDTSWDLPAERRQFALLLSQLRAAEPRFAEASILQPDEVGEWHAAIYLLTGCQSVWETLGPEIVTQRSLDPVRKEVESSRGLWTSDQRATMEWALHFWCPDQFTASFPATFRRFLFTRWVVASYLRQGLPPTIRLEQT